MNPQNGENLRELFEKFAGGEEAKKAVEDISQGERILRQHPAPPPSDELIAQVQAKAAGALAANKARAFRRAVYKVAAVAAVFFIAAVASVRLVGPPEDKTDEIYSASIIPAAIWESDDIAADDTDLALLSAEVNELRQEMLALRLGENGGNGLEDLTELEMELAEVNGDFWKG
ncbi:MAG: hypothetical protein ACYTEQ_12100 [Planctomycetota bacterium]|jgi:hypothetical protein